jgi:hypothetical protein
MRLKRQDDRPHWLYSTYEQQPLARAGIMALIRHNDVADQRHWCRHQMLGLLSFPGDALRWLAGAIAYLQRQ